MENSACNRCVHGFYYLFIFSGKKSKQKWKPVAVTDVIAESGLPYSRKTSSWADESEPDIGKVS